MNKKHLPSIHNYNLDIDLKQLQDACDTLAGKFVDVKTANPMLCDNHMELVAHVYDNFEQINLTTPSEILKKNIYIMCLQKITQAVILKK